MSTSRRASKWAALGAVTTVAVSGLSVVGTGAAVAAVPPAPVGLSPNSTVTAHKNVELTWTPIVGASSYQIQVLDDDNIDVARKLEGTSPIARWTVPVTLPTGEYRWRVRAVSADGTGTWSALATLERGWERSTTTDAETAGEAVPTFSWASLPDASFYEVEVSPTSFRSPQYSVDKTFVCRTAHTTITPYAVALGGDAFVSPPGDESSCAFTAGDTATAPKPTPTPTASPTDTPTATPTAEPEPEPEVADSYVFGKTYYWRVRGRDGTIDTRPTDFTASPGACVGPWLKSGITVETDDSGGRVVTVPLPTEPPTAEPTPECSTWSAEKTFIPTRRSVGVVSSAPTGLSAGPLAGGSASRVTASPTFRWDRTPGAAKYRFYYSRDRLVGSVDFAAETMGTTFTPVSSLDLGSTTRYWAVQACGTGFTSTGDEECGPVSAAQPISQVTTNYTSPISLSARTGYLLATWATGAPTRSPAKFYEVQLTNTETGAMTVTQTDRLALNVDSGTSSLAFPSADMAEATYAFQVRPVDEAGRFPAWSGGSGEGVVDRTTPTVKISTAAGRFVNRVPIGILFSEPVTNVSSSTVTIKTSTGATVPGVVRRFSASHYSFTPTSAWLTGSYSRVYTDGVVDRASKLVVASRTAVRAGTTADSPGDALKFYYGDTSWPTRTSSDAYNRNYRQTFDDASTAKKGYASVLVHGTGIAVQVCKSPKSGSVRVYIDGKLRTTTSLYRSWTGCFNTIRIAGLTRANHRVTLVGVSTNGRGVIGIDRVAVL